PKRPPGNISWSFSGSTVSIKWDPVVAKADESAVTGYKVQAGLPFGVTPGEPQGTKAQNCLFQQMLYRQDSHSAPTLYLASKSRIDIPIPEDFTHAFVQIRVTGPGGDGTPAEVHILRNTGTSMMVEDSVSRPVPHAVVITTNSLLMVALISSLEL
ncbi:CNTN2 protein, partial [Campylorhamphus procurvoides]|nr:CNTN2 protein [Campylorhamphus procurvoides]